MPANLRDLPFEVHKLILKHLLIFPYKIRLHDITGALAPTKYFTLWLQTSVLRVCKTIYAAGMEVLYGENTFVLPSFVKWPPFPSFVKRVDTTLVRRLALWCSFGNPDAFRQKSRVEQFATAFPNIVSIELDNPHLTGFTKDRDGESLLKLFDDTEQSLKRVVKSHVIMRHIFWEKFRKHGESRWWND
ncbi:hypothetical protein MMC13_000694 [Lambiella insularis]|nr:hypothetical protein [Lambiella insularis]